MRNRSQGGFLSVGQMIVLVIGILILGLGGVIIASWNELVEWSRTLRTNMNSSAGTTGGVLPGLVVTAAWLSAKLGR